MFCVNQTCAIISLNRVYNNVYAKDDALPSGVSGAKCTPGYIVRHGSTSGVEMMNNRESHIEHTNTMLTMYRQILVSTSPTYSDQPQRRTQVLRRN